MNQNVDLNCAYGDKQAVGFAERRDLPKPERMWRAARMLGILWAIALVAAFIPILHFFLVPLFLLLGIALSIMTWLEKAFVEGGEIPCPNCGKTISLEKCAESWPKTQRCPGCFVTLEIKQRQ